MKDNILIYGAGGYMGKLFTQYAQNQQLPIVLGSKDSFPTPHELRVFSIDHVPAIIKHLGDVKLVVNLAGPFAFTQQPFIEACIQTGTHYIDIAGEVPEFESAFRFDALAQKSKVMVLPGAGFGVVPTDIAATLAHQKLPDATHLIIAYVTQGGATRGTLKTVLKDIHKEGIEIVNGKALKAMPAKSAFHFELDGQKQRGVYNPWRGDLFTAQHSTSIPNIQTYSNFPGFVESMMKGKLLWLRDLLLKRFITLLPIGPSEKELQKGKTYIYAQTQNASGATESVTIKGPEAYLFTVQCLINITFRIMGDDVTPGFQVPSIYGKEILLDHYQNVQID
jgi:short subunit dehydrogenase-like uncharacterized protein